MTGPRRRSNIWKRKHLADQAKREKLEREFEGALKNAENTLRKIADQVLPRGKFTNVARDRTAEFLSDAAHLVRRVRNREDRSRR